MRIGEADAGVIGGWPSSSENKKEALESKLFEAPLVFVDAFSTDVNQLRTWGNGCPCHGDVDPKKASQVRRF